MGSSLTAGSVAENNGPAGSSPFELNGIENELKETKLGLKLCLPISHIYKTLEEKRCCVCRCRILVKYQCRNAHVNQASENDCKLSPER